MIVFLDFHSGITTEFRLKTPLHRTRCRDFATLYFLLDTFTSASKMGNMELVYLWRIKSLQRIIVKNNERKSISDPWLPNNSCLHSSILVKCLMTSSLLNLDFCNTGLHVSEPKR